MPDTSNEQESESVSITRHWKKAEGELRAEREKLLSELIVKAYARSGATETTSSFSTLVDGSIRELY